MRAIISMTVGRGIRWVLAGVALCLPLVGGAWDAIDVDGPVQQQAVDQRFRHRNVFDNRRIERAPVMAGPAIHTPHEGPITAAAIRTAIEDGLLFLRSRQAPDGSIGSGYAPGGSTALAALAMLAAGVDPLSDPALKAAMAHLLALPSDNTYVRGIRANVWEYALRKAPHVEGWREALKADLAWLLAARNDVAWRYSASSRDWDNSCTQYAALGLWAAQRAGLETGDAVWDALSKHFRRTQNADGGWGYVEGSASTPNMATAGLATMYLVFDHHYGRRGAWRTGKPAPFAGGEARAVLDAIDRGLSWLASADGDKSHAYYLYGIERTGVAGGQRLLGGVDWFAEGADAALRAQRADGAIPLGYSDEIGTALTTLFLVYGGAPAAFAKLQYGEGEDWNLNPRDLANLTRRLWQAYERPLNWYTVSADAPVEAFDAPILFVSGSRAAVFSDAQVATLRAYVARGGMILAEPSDGSPAFRASMVELVGRLFPPDAYPGMGLAPLEADHGIYSVVKHDWKARPKLSGVSDGVRTVFVLSDGYLAADWQTDRVEADAFALAMNLLFHATALRPLDGRFAAVALPEDGVAKRDGSVVVARARFGVGQDWDAGAAVWERVRPYVEHVTGLSVRGGAAVALDDGLVRSDVQLLHMTGRRGFELSEAEVAALVGFVGRGGTVLVDAFGGSEAFGEAARAVIERAFGGVEAVRGDEAWVAGLFEGGVDVSRVRYDLGGRRRLRSMGVGVDGLRMGVVRRGERPAVVVSGMDLSAGIAGVDVYGGAGLVAGSARAVVGNLVGWIGRE